MLSGFMRALVVHRPGGPDSMTLDDVPKPAARAGQVVIAVEAVGVNPVDAGNRADPAWAGIEAPYVVGYELAGVIDAVGTDVVGLEPGEPVWALLPVRGTRWGTYAEFVAVDAQFVGVRPPALDAVQAAAIPLAGATALQLLDRLDPPGGDWIVVHGAAGGVGSLLVQLARARGVRVAGSSSAQRHGFLRGLGVELALDRGDDDALDRAVAAMAVEPFAVADLVGQGLLARSLPYVREGGAAGTIVELHGDFEEAIDRNITIHGVLVRPGRKTLERLADAVAAGSLRPVVDEVVDIEDAAAAHRRVETGHGQGKVVLRGFGARQGDHASTGAG
jgi:NADPH2:quinone reductase